MTKKRAASEPRSHLLKMRRVMRTEAATLLKGLLAHQKSLRTRLERLGKRLDRDSDTTLLSELAAVRDELAAVRRGLARLAIAEQPTLKLKNEWHDWLRHADMSEHADHELRRERLEMLASELRARGVEVPEITLPVSRVARPAKQVAVPAAIERIELEEASTETADEEPETTDWNEVSDYWEQLIGGLDPEHADPAQLARLLKAFRDVQGERKLQDRQDGVRRYRLTAFETWH